MTNEQDEALAKELAEALDRGTELDLDKDLRAQPARVARLVEAFSMGAAALERSAETLADLLELLREKFASELPSSSYQDAALGEVGDAWKAHLAALEHENAALRGRIATLEGKEPEEISLPVPQDLTGRSLLQVREEALEWQERAEHAEAQLANQRLHIRALQNEVLRLKTKLSQNLPAMEGDEL